MLSINYILFPIFVINFVIVCYFSSRVNIFVARWLKNNIKNRIARSVLQNVWHLNWAIYVVCAVLFLPWLNTTLGIFEENRMSTWGFAIFGGVIILSMMVTQKDKQNYAVKSGFK